MHADFAITPAGFDDDDNDDESARLLKTCDADSEIKQVGVEASSPYHMFKITDVFCPGLQLRLRILGIRSL